MKLLIIDDEKDILDVISEIIEINEIPVETMKANTVTDAEALLPYCDMIISDVNMPEKDRLEQLLDVANKPTLRITGHDDFHCEMYIEKPFEIKAIIDAVNFLIKQVEG